MRIVHIDPSAAYNEGWGYHDNLLPEYHRRSGHEVTVIVSGKSFENGAQVETEPQSYTLPDGRRIIRLKKKNMGSGLLSGLCSHISVYELLKELSPDLIFHHGLVSTTVFDAIRYKKRVNSDCVIFEDNHIDYYNNTIKASGLSGFLIRSFYVLLNKLAGKSISKVYGVTPWRKQFAEEFFKIPKSITDVSIMGAADAEINPEGVAEIRKELRGSLGFRDRDFVVITGGKIDKFKNIHLLAEAIELLKLDRLKLVIFGEVSHGFESEMAEITDNPNVKMLGWLPANRVYDYFSASDLIVFPGTHSVLWEQACACGVPALFKDWGEGMRHVSAGDNCGFLTEDSAEEIAEKIKVLIEDEEKYSAMKSAALNCREEFYYSRIAERIIDDYEKIRGG